MVRINLASLLSSPAFISSFHQTGSWESGKMDSSIDGLRLSTVNTDVQVLGRSDVLGLVFSLWTRWVQEVRQLRGVEGLEPGEQSVMDSTYPPVLVISKAVTGPATATLTIKCRCTILLFAGCTPAGTLRHDYIFASPLFMRSRAIRLQLCHLSSLRIRGWLLLCFALQPQLPAPHASVSLRPLKAFRELESLVFPDWAVRPGIEAHVRLTLGKRNKLMHSICVDWEILRCSHSCSTLKYCTGFSQYELINESRQMQPLFLSFHSCSSPSFTGHLQRYRSHSSINNALAARSTRVTIPMLFSCRSTFPGLPVFLSSAAQTQAVYLLLPGSLRPAGMMIASPSLFRRIKNLERQRQLTCWQYEARLSFPRFSSMQIHCCGSKSRPHSTALV